MNEERKDSRQTALVGLSAIAVFITSFISFGLLAEDYHFLTDYLSLLGAKGQPLGLYWNLTGFVFVGLLIARFGWGYGKVHKDMIIGSCLVVAGLFYALGGIPSDFNNAEATTSIAHFAAICFSLAGWSLALARITQIGDPNSGIIKRANWSIIAVIIVLVGAGIGLYAEPVVHRLIILVIFSWIALSAKDLLRREANQV